MSTLLHSEHDTTLRVSTQMEIRHHCRPQVEEMEKDGDEEFTRTSYHLIEFWLRCRFCTRIQEKKKVGEGTPLCNFNAQTTWVPHGQVFERRNITPSASVWRGRKRWRIIPTTVTSQSRGLTPMQVLHREYHIWMDVIEWVARSLKN